MFREYERDFRWLLHEVGHLYNYSLYNVSFSRLTLTHLYFYFVWEIQKKTDNNQSLSSMSRDSKALFEFVKRIPLLLLLQSGEDRLGNSFFLQKDLIQMQYDSLLLFPVLHKTWRLLQNKIVTSGNKMFDDQHP